jgi:hypothetical protein
MHPPELFKALATAALLAAGRSWADSPDAVVTFNELHYNPPVTQNAEWVELHNQMAVNIDLSGWSLSDGISYTFPPGTVIPGGGFFVVAKLPGHASLAGVPNVFGPFTGNLSNGGETIDLLSPTGRLMDRLSYGDSGSWPATPDGAGATLAKRRPGSTAADPANWRASPTAGGTPAGVNFQPNDIPQVHVFADADTFWRYSDSTTAPPGSWAETGFDDSAWSEGQAPFGSSSLPPVLGVTADLVERFRASDVTGIANGGIFSPWNDTATGDGVAQNATPVSNPQFYSDAANRTPSGQPVVDFDGNDQFRTSLSPGIAPDSGFAYFIVCRANGPPTNGGVGDGSGDYLFDRDATTGNPLVSLKADNNRYGFQKRYDDGSGLGGMVSTTPISTAQFQIVAVRRNRSLGRFEIWVDGVMEATTPDTGGNLTPQPIVIGNHHSGGTQGFNGDIAELLIYRNELSASDFQAVGAYLESRYGLATAFLDSTARTPLATSASTTYFRTSFTFSGDPARTSLSLDHTLADGAVFFLNGQEIARHNLPGGVIGHSTSALSDVGFPQSTGLQTVPAGALVNGTNVLAVSVHTGASDNTAWFTASLRGEETLPDPDLPPALQIHEIAGSGDSPFFIELRNTTDSPVSTAGFTLEAAGLISDTYLLPAIIVPPGGLVHYTDTQLGFLPADGDKLILRSPAGHPVDARNAELVTRGRSDLWPDRWLFPSAATPGSANVFNLRQEIVINEICYNPPDVSPASAGKQWIELHNRGAAPVDLGGWRFSSGIDFSFPSPTVIGPGGYLLVAKSPGNFTPAPGATVLGPWSGNLAGGGEKITLLDAAGNPADEVSYLDGGRWPADADGGGSTLELRDPHSDNSLPGSWAASDENPRRAWQTCTYRATAAASTGPDNQWKEFVFGLLDGGDVLIDDISVVENPDSSAVQLIANGGFQAGITGWRFLGNHRHARIVSDPDSPGNNVLHLSAKGPTEHMHNHVETTLDGGLSVVNGRVYEISFRARWLSGSNRLNTRLYFNRVAKTTELARSDIPGTPGAANSTAVANSGPGFTALSHSPVVPAPGETVTITTRAADPDGLGTLTLHYSVNGGEFTPVVMTPSGDGSTFTASIPGQSAATVVRFHVAATDAAPSPATSFHPASGPASHALYQVDEGLAAGNGLQNIRIVMDPADEALLYQTNNLMSNERLGCTVIYGEREAYYDAGVRLKSSQRGRTAPARVGFNLGFNKDQLFRGIHRTIAIDRSEGQITGCQEILYDHMMYASGGVPAEYNDLCKVIAPDPAHTSHAILQMARFNDVFLDSQFENGSDGTAYEYELIYYPTTTDANGFKLPQPDSVVGTDITDLGDDKENYRWNFLLENNEDVDDYSRVISLGKHFAKTGAAFETGLGGIIDIDQWLRATAYACASGAGDSFFANSNHNGIFYARPDGRMLFFPHDMDFSFSATRGIFVNTELQKLVADGGRRRAYLGHLHHICTTVFNQSYMSAWTAHYGSLLPGENFSGHLSYVNTRSNYILGAINADTPSIPFAITTNGGANFSTGTSPVTLAGEGWVNIRAIRLAGSSVPLASNWTSVSTWEVSVPLAIGPNVIVLEAVDFNGAVVGTDSITVTNTGGIEPPQPSTLVISEIYYNPPGDLETAEYVELMNTSAATLDLSNVGFTAGVTFTFPGGTQLAPGGRILVIKDQAGFEQSFGTGLPVAGTFPNNLSNSGERLELRRADGGVLHSFTYRDIPPWPVEADGGGYSLVLANPYSNPDHGDPLSWRASLSAAGGSPGSSDSQSYDDWKAANGNPGDDEDLDGDGYTTRGEYFLGGNPLVAEPALSPTFEIEAGGTFLMSVTRRVTAENATVLPQVSLDLTNWTGDPSAVFLSNIRQPRSPAVDRLTFRLTPPAAATRFFSRFAFGP